LIPFDRLCISSLSINPASVGSNTSAEQSFTLPGVQIGDVILDTIKPSLTAGLSLSSARVSAANTIAITFVNSTAAPIDAAAETYTLVILRPEKVIAGAAQFNAM
jgi:hypothetical protein